MCEHNHEELVEIIEVIEAFEGATKRIPVKFGNITFFGSEDQWTFIRSDHPNMCPECDSYHLNTYFGNSIRSEFPWLQIRDENTIYPSVHPNCYCTLVRVFPVTSEKKNEKLLNKLQYNSTYYLKCVGKNVDAKHWTGERPTQV